MRDGKVRKQSHITIGGVSQRLHLAQGGQTGRQPPKITCGMFGLLGKIHQDTLFRQHPRREVGETGAKNLPQGHNGNEMHTERSSLTTRPMCAKITTQLRNEMAEYLTMCTPDPTFLLFNKVCTAHRMVGFFSNIATMYNYSNTKTPAHPLVPCLEALLDYINEQLGSHFNSVLVNVYRTGEDWIGQHSDDERTLDKDAGVVIVSIGAERTMIFKDKTTKETVHTLLLQESEYTCMSGAFQQEFTHGINKQLRAKNAKNPLPGLPPTARISFTLRYHIS